MTDRSLARFANVERYGRSFASSWPTWLASARSAALRGRRTPRSVALADAPAAMASYFSARRTAAAALSAAPARSRACFTYRGSTARGGRRERCRDAPATPAVALPAGEPASSRDDADRLIGDTGGIVAPAAESAPCLLGGAVCAAALDGALRLCRLARTAAASASWPASHARRAAGRRAGRCLSSVRRASRSCRGSGLSTAAASDDIERSTSPVGSASMGGFVSRAGGSLLAGARADGGAVVTGLPFSVYKLSSAARVAAARAASSSSSSSSLLIAAASSPASIRSARRCLRLARSHDLPSLILPSRCSRTTRASASSRCALSSSRCALLMRSGRKCQCTTAGGGGPRANNTPGCSCRSASATATTAVPAGSGVAISAARAALSAAASPDPSCRKKASDTLPNRPSRARCRRIRRRAVTSATTAGSVADTTLPPPEAAPPPAPEPRP
mmetsp:Transcript_3968/g.16561  ORF Transcript_3968/g.16561 Transcript_3968/m.16561 type:complete len:448 (+) Transcript_3968:281-1624(+)